MGDFTFWISNDAGGDRALMDVPVGDPGFAFFDYLRSAIGLGYLHIGMPLEDFLNAWPTGFEPDLILEVWRSPGLEGYEPRLENKFFLRKHRVYNRESDNVEMIEMWARSPLDLVKRRYVIQPAETSFTSKNDEIDDMMKDIVRENALFGYAAGVDGESDTDREYPQGEFTVEDEHSLGPVVDRSFPDRNVMDILKDLRDLSFQKNLEDTANKKIYFDVVPGASLDWNKIYILEENAAFSPILDESGDPLLDERSLAATIEKAAQFQFQTFADLRGQDRTGESLVFSLENGNIAKPSRIVDHMDEVNVSIVRGQGRGDNRLTAEVVNESAMLDSRWNRIESTESAASQTDEDALEEVGKAALWKDQTERILDVEFLDTPGSEVQPRSLYGVDWDLGDLLPVLYAGISENVEVLLVYVTMSEDGQEQVTGRNQIE